MMEVTGYWKTKENDCKNVEGHFLGEGKYLGERMYPLKKNSKYTKNKLLYYFLFCDILKLYLIISRWIIQVKSVNRIFQNVKVFVSLDNGSESFFIYSWYGFYQDTFFFVNRYFITYVFNNPEILFHTVTRVRDSVTSFAEKNNFLSRDNQFKRLLRGYICLLR